MKEERLLKLNLFKGQLILIHLVSGVALCGEYLANYNSDTLEFDFENHRSQQIERIKLEDIEDVVI